MREAACLAIGMFAQCLHPEILGHVEMVLPNLLQAVAHDGSEAVKEKACYAIEAFCEDLGDKVAPFLLPLTERLGALLQVIA